ncbi:MAG: UbiH/UbiF family hydroxylase [Rhodocyclaceae bacterium]|nr:UbiH/UbiF family hydroxylase [Rhodocyclaceae bacterium]MBX3666863.1 UbiH/UbiF family hydroxylase [Rhodocyclaceae bacterium]
MKTDILIVGGGLAGTSLAVALRKSRYSVALVEARAPAPAAGEWDARVYAVSPSNAAFLGDLGVWKHLDAARLTRIERMQVFGDEGGVLEFSAYASGVGELAWIAESSLVARELWEHAKRQPNLELICPAQPHSLSFGPAAATLDLNDGRTLEASLVIGADGVQSWVRQQAGLAANVQAYDELGVVANFATELPHAGTAWQWFRADGVLAWLPLPGRRMSIVWSTPEEHGRELLQLAPDEFCRRVQEAGGSRLGQLQLITPPAGFPLRLMRLPRTIAPRLALIGDAAHAIHPLSGHGINLGFADARELARLLMQTPAYADIGDERCLRPYERCRREEVAALQWTTDALQKLFRPRSAILRSARNAGLNLTGRLPVLRDALVRYALG